MPRPFEELVDEAGRAPIRGWDFGWLEGRATEERPSWRYFDLVAGRVHGVDRLLDIQAGTGAMVAALPYVPSLSVATEGYGPNVPIAAERLRSLVFSGFDRTHGRYFSTRSKRSLKLPVAWTAD